MNKQIEKPRALDAAGSVAGNALVAPRAGEVVAAVIYYRVSRRRVWCPHSVFTTVPGSGRYTEYDFDWARRQGVVCYNESGCGGRVYLHPMMNRSGRDVAVWWNRALTQPTDGRSVASPILAERTIRRWGYQLPAAPLGLMGTAGTNPFEIGCLTEAKTVHCKHCRSSVPTESDDPCEHLTWSDEHSEFRYHCHSVSRKTSRAAA